MMGSVKSAIKPSETKVAQKTLRSILLFYRRGPRNSPFRGVMISRKTQIEQ